MEGKCSMIVSDILRKAKNAIAIAAVVLRVMKLLQDLVLVFSF